MSGRLRLGDDVDAVAGGSDEKDENGGSKASAWLSGRAVSCEKTRDAENEQSGETVFCVITFRAGYSTSKGLPTETEVDGDLSCDNNVEVETGVPEGRNEGEPLFLEEWWFPGGIF